MRGQRATGKVERNDYHRASCGPSLKPGLHIVVRIAEHACDDASKRILKLSTYRLKLFLVKYQNLLPLQPFRVQTISVQLKIHVRDYVLAILTTYMKTRLNG